MQQRRGRGRRRPPQRAARRRSSAARDFRAAGSPARGPRPGQLLLSALAPLLLAPLGAAANPLPEPGDAAWQEVRFPSISQTTTWDATQIDGRRVWRATAKCSASGLALAIDPPIALGNAEGNTRLQLRWRWRVDEPLGLGADERTRPGDDFAARVSALFAFDPSGASAWERARRRVFGAVYGAELPGRSLGFVWARALPRGSAWTSPYGNGSELLALRGKEDGATWFEERVDLAAEHRKRFGEPPTALIGIALMTDADNGCSSASALYADFALDEIP